MGRRPAFEFGHDVDRPPRPHDLFQLLPRHLWHMVEEGGLGGHGTRPHRRHGAIGFGCRRYPFCMRAASSVRCGPVSRSWHQSKTRACCRRSAFGPSAHCNRLGRRQLSRPRSDSRVPWRTPAPPWPRGPPGTDRTACQRAALRSRSRRRRRNRAGGSSRRGCSVLTTIGSPAGGNCAQPEAHATANSNIVRKDIPPIVS